MPNTTHSLPARNRGKPGELLLIGGALCLLATPMVWALNSEADDALTTLSEQGVVSEASVVDKSVVTQSHTNRRGVPQTTTIHRISVSYDIDPATSYRDWAQSGELQVRSDATYATQWVDVLSIDYANYSRGQTVVVVFLPHDSGSLMLAEQLKFRLSPTAHGLWLIAYAGAVIAGCAMIFVGWRKRFRRGHA